LWPEARVCATGHRSAMAGGAQTESAVALAKLSWDLIHDNAFAAFAAVERKVVTPALERIVEANTLLSGLGLGLGLGFESGVRSPGGSLRRTPSMTGSPPSRTRTG